MARRLDADLAEHVIQVVTTLATCWRIKRSDGVVEGYTDHDVPITIEAVEYVPSGISPTSTSSEKGMTVDTLELHGLVTENSDVPAQIVGKRYDGAQVDVFTVNYAAPPSTITETSVIWIKTGVVGDISRERGQWVVEGRSLLDLLKQANAVRTSRLCRYQFGDSRCMADLTQYQKTATVTGVNGRRITTDATGVSSGDMENGLLTVDSLGVSFDIASNSGARLVLTETPEVDLNGASVTLTFGCNKWLTDCEKYNNVINYGGEPYIPDADEWAAGYFSTVSV